MDVAPAIPMPGATSSQDNQAMTDLSAPIKPAAMTMEAHSPGLALRSLVIGLTAFLTVVDLFAHRRSCPR
ncbi:hypothetical protein TM239_60190 [Bradyrhizobium sp. TM239]|nr:hypothetical protein TM239_60190 [Bradyrhizobium sp. TM239]